MRPPALVLASTWLLACNGQPALLATGDAAADGAAVAATEAGPDRVPPFTLAEVARSPDAPGALLVLDRAAIEFDEVGAGCVGAAPTAITVTNVGGAPSALISIALTVDFLVHLDGCTGLSLAPGQRCSVGIRFGPISGGPRAGAFTLSAGSEEVSAQLRGTAHEQPLVGKLDVSPANLNFTGPAGGRHAGQPQAVEVTSPDPAARLAATFTIEGRRLPEFAVSKNGCPRPLEPGVPCAAEVVFIPSTLGGHSGVLHVVGRPAPGLCGAAHVRVTLTGNGLKI